MTNATQPPAEGPMKKYVLHPGLVRSKFDGDTHFISASQLAHLYGVDIRECITVSSEDKISRDGLDTFGYTHLYPSYHGTYRRQYKHKEKTNDDYSGKA